jgi:hypothetical protein
MLHVGLVIRARAAGSFARARGRCWRRACSLLPPVQPRYLLVRTDLIQIQPLRPCRSRGSNLCRDRCLRIQPGALQHPVPDAV